MQRVPVEVLVTDADMGDAHTQPLAGQDGVDRFGLLDHRASVGDRQHGHLGAEQFGARLREGINVAGSETDRGRHQPDRRLAIGKH